MEENEIHPLVQFLRLQNGDDVIAEVIETEDDEGILYTLFHPLKVMYIDAEREGYTAIAFSPWVFPSLCDQQEFVIHAEDIMLITNVSEKMNRYYWSSVDQYYSPEPVEKSESVSDRMQRFKDMLEDAGYDGDMRPLDKKVMH
jgi:hypothetical protein